MRSLSTAGRGRVLLPLVAVALVLVLALFGVTRREEARAVAVRGDVRICATLQGEDARACYGREVARQLAAIGGRDVGKAAAAAASSIEFAAASANSSALLCDLHARVGGADSATPSWVGWNEPLVQG
jgi:hypothetical protein